jgi:epoxyqueuosine reductase QueG
MSQIETSLETQAKILGVELFGVTSIENFYDHKGVISKTILKRYKNAISIGYVIPKSILYDSTSDYYTYFLNNTITPTLDRASLYLSRIIERNDGNAFPVPAYNYINDSEYPFYFHDLVASYSGIGWLGKNNRLINKKYGARVQCGTILTDLELETDEISENFCKDCNICTENCPEVALSGFPFHPDHDVNERLNSKKCLLEYSGSSVSNICLKCLNVCPYNK